MFEFREAERPYPGLRPFEAHESGIFFGREEHTDRLLEISDLEYAGSVLNWDQAT